MNDARKKVLLKIIEKRAFSPASAMGGAPPGQPPMDPAAMQGQMPPMDPSMGGGMAAAGGQPMVDPATGMPMDPAAGGGAPPVDPATGMPMDPAAAGGGGDPMTMPITELTVGDLVQLIGQVVMEATGQGGGGEGGMPPGGDPQAAMEELAQQEMGPEPEGGEPSGAAEGTKADDNDIVDRLDQILELLGAGMGAPAGGGEAPMQPMGHEAGAMAPAPPGPKMASTKIGTTSLADRIVNKVKGL